MLTLQKVVEACADFDAGSADPLLNTKVTRFDFDGLVTQFDAERAADPGPGMQVMAEIHLGSRTVLEYLLSPVQKAFHRLHVNVDTDMTRTNMTKANKTLTTIIALITLPPSLRAVLRGISAPTVLGSLVIIAACGTALAQQFEMIEEPKDGRGIPYAPPRDPTVCEAYRRNLNAASHKNSFECERELAPASAGFAKPTWQALNPADHAGLIRKMERSLSPKSVQDEKVWTDKLRSRIRDKTIALSVADIDINDDGIAEKVIRYERSGPCNRDSPEYVRRSGSQQFFVVDESLKDLAGPSKDGYFLIPGVRHDVFFYRGRTYFDFVSDALGPDRKRLVVQQTQTSRPPTPVCIYEITGRVK